MDPELLHCCWGSGILLGATHGVSTVGGSIIAWSITKVDLQIVILEDKDVLKEKVIVTRKKLEAELGEKMREKMK